MAKKTKRERRTLQASVRMESVVVKELEPGDVVWYVINRNRYTACGPFQVVSVGEKNVVLRNVSGVEFRAKRVNDHLTYFRPSTQRFEVPDDPYEVWGP